MTDESSECILIVTDADSDTDSSWANHHVSMVRSGSDELRLGHCIQYFHPCRGGAITTLGHNKRIALVKIFVSFSSIKHFADKTTSSR